MWKEVISELLTHLYLLQLRWERKHDRHFKSCLVKESSTVIQEDPSEIMFLFSVFFLSLTGQHVMWRPQQQWLHLLPLHSPFCLPESPPAERRPRCGDKPGWAGRGGRAYGRSWCREHSWHGGDRRGIERSDSDAGGHGQPTHTHYSNRCYVTCQQQVRVKSAWLSLVSLCMSVSKQ